MKPSADGAQARRGALKTLLPVGAIVLVCLFVASPTSMPVSIASVAGAVQGATCRLPPKFVGYKPSAWEQEW